MNHYYYPHNFHVLYEGMPHVKYVMLVKTVHATLYGTQMTSDQIAVHVVIIMTLKWQP